VPEAAALAAALSWSLCSLAFAAAGRQVGALVVNQVRIVAAVLLLAALHVAWLGNLWPWELTAPQQGWLALSGLIGLTLGDLCHFRALREIGPRLGLLLHGTWPVMAAILAWTVRGEQPGFHEGLGIALVVVGTGVVVTGGDRQWSAGLRAPAFAIALGLLGALGQAVGAVLAKDILADGAHALSSTLVRIAAGAAGMLLITVAAGRGRAVLASLHNRPAQRNIAIGTVLGPVLGVWLSMVALQGTSTGTAAALMATAPIWMLPIGRFAYGSKLTWRAVLGTAVAVAGSVLLLT